MPRPRPGKTARLIYIDDQIDAWLQQNAKEGDRSITAEINRTLRAGMAKDQQPQRKAG